MPLLMCPNDNAGMQTVTRSGVQFDICPTCRGVWLDRGELEKLMSAAKEEGGGAPPEYRQESRPPEPPRYSEPPRRYSDDHRRWEDDKYRHKKRRGFDIFDIFD